MHILRRNTRLDNQKVRSLDSIPKEEPSISWKCDNRTEQTFLIIQSGIPTQYVPDLFSATPEEMAELQKVVQQFREMGKEMFGAKMFSYIGQTSLENLHANLQIVPRYDGQVTFGDTRFVDPGFGRGVDPIRNQIMSDGQYSELIDAMREHLKGRPQEETEEEPVEE